MDINLPTRFVTSVKNIREPKFNGLDSNDLVSQVASSILSFRKTHLLKDDCSAALMKAIYLNLANKKQWHRNSCPFFSCNRVYK